MTKLEIKREKDRGETEMIVILLYKLSFVVIPLQCEEIIKCTFKKTMSHVRNMILGRETTYMG